MSYNYDEAFSRNLGILTPSDMSIIKKTKVGIAGMGGSGSNYLLALTRLGFENFVIADPDIYEIANINRQAGADTTSFGKNKVAVMKEMALKINPNLVIDSIEEGFSDKTSDRFFKDTNIVIDAIDFLRMDLHQMLHDESQARGIYSICGGSPFGFGVSLTVFGPNTLTFNQAFNILNDDDLLTRMKKFFKGMTSGGLPYAYLDEKLTNLPDKIEDVYISSVSPSLYLATAMASSEVLFTILNKRSPMLVPNVLQIDLFTRTMSVSHISTI